MVKTITILDLGSFEARAILATFKGTEPPQVLGVGKIPSKGIKKGVVVDINEASQMVRHVLQIVENISGLSRGELLVAVNGTNLKSVNTKGIVAVSRADRQIMQSDVERAVRAAQVTLAAPNREIISIMPRGFSIDNEEGIRNPIGMNGIRLEVDTVIISASSPFLRNLSKAVSLSGAKPSEFIPGPLACGEALISKKQKELGTAVVDIGSDTTSIILYEDGEVLSLEVLPVGSNLITSDIAIGLRIDIDSAETIKVKYGTALPEKVRKTEVIELRSLGLEDDSRVRRVEVAEIIAARARELLAMVGRNFEKVGRRNFLPAGVVLAGGGSKLEGMVDIAKDELKLPVRLGFPEHFQGLVDEVLDPSFVKGAGLVMWRVHQETLKPSHEESSIQKIGSVFQDFFRRILP